MSSRGSGLILVKIAAYRDRDLATTVASALSNAEDSERLRFAIVHQWGPETKAQLSPVADDTRFAILSLPWTHARGLGWARARCDAMWSGEEFSLQVDAHTRFAPGWDALLEREWRQLGHERALLSCYPGEYRRHGAGQVILLPATPHLIRVTGRADNGAVLQDAGDAAAAGARTHLVSGGFQFGPGELSHRVRHPESLMNEDELVQAARFFTHGVDVLVPGQEPLFHLYAKDKDSDLDHGMSGDFAADPTLADALARWKQASRARVASAFRNPDDEWWGPARPLQDFVGQVDGLARALALAS